MIREQIDQMDEELREIVNNIVTNPKEKALLYTALKGFKGKVIKNIIREMEMNFDAIKTQVNNSLPL